MEVGVAAAPVGDLGEGVSGQDVLGEQRESGADQGSPRAHSDEHDSGQLGATGPRTGTSQPGAGREGFL